MTAMLLKPLLQSQMRLMLLLPSRPPPPLERRLPTLRSLRKLKTNKLRPPNLPRKLNRKKIRRMLRRKNLLLRRSLRMMPRISKLRP